VTRVSLSRLTVRQRLTLTVAIATALGLLVVGVTMYVVESRRIDRSVSVALASELGEMRAFQRSARDPDTRGPFTSPDRIITAFLERNLPDQNEIIFAFPSTGAARYVGESRPALRQSAAFRALVARNEDGGGTESLTVAGEEYRIAVLPVTDGTTTAAFVVVHDVSLTRDPLHDLMITYTLLALLAVLVIAALSSWLAGRLLAPVRRLRDTARGITDGDLNRRIEVTGQDDLADLQRTFNDMLDRLESAFNTQRQLLDDAGHELRTPLTILRGHLEVLDQADPDDVSATRALLLDETDRMARLVDDLLVLAKARRPDFVVAAPTDVERLTQGVLDRARGLADRHWVLDGVARTSAPLDGQRITQALLQLADNAVRHTQPGDEIGIGSRLHEGQLELWVRDTGSGVDPAVRQHIFHRFVRDDDGDDGFGLGLSIVTAIAEAHGGRATLDDTSPGATFRVQVPRGAAW
jgi:two-component system OmpR family sensor kinase